MGEFVTLTVGQSAESIDQVQLQHIAPISGADDSVQDLSSPLALSHDPRRHGKCNLNNVPVSRHFDANICESAWQDDQSNLWVDVSPPVHSEHHQIYLLPPTADVDEDHLQWPTAGSGECLFEKDAQWQLLVATQRRARCCRGRCAGAQRSVLTACSDSLLSERHVDAELRKPAQAQCRTVTTCQHRSQQSPSFVEAWAAYTACTVFVHTGLPCVADTASGSLTHLRYQMESTTRD